LLAEEHSINPTRSTGYGEKFADAIQNDWSGAPYDDLVQGFEHIADNYEYIDTKNVVAAGASYRGHMVSTLRISRTAH
jgi:dipeptidyl aminopeptidase/acylaminoacyl peptidase